MSERKYCQYNLCGKELIQKPNEHKSLWDKRKFCNRQCAIKHFRTTSHWREYPVKLQEAK